MPGLLRSVCRHRSGGDSWDKHESRPYNHQGRTQWDNSPKHPCRIHATQTHKDYGIQLNTADQVCLFLSMVCRGFTYLWDCPSKVFTENRDRGRVKSLHEKSTLKSCAIDQNTWKREVQSVLTGNHQHTIQNQQTTTCSQLVRHEENENP